MTLSVNGYTRRLIACTITNNKLDGPARILSAGTQPRKSSRHHSCPGRNSNRKPSKSQKPYRLSQNTHRKGLEKNVFEPHMFRPVYGTIRLPRNLVLTELTGSKRVIKKPTRAPVFKTRAGYRHFWAQCNHKFGMERGQPTRSPEPTQHMRHKRQLQPLRGSRSGEAPCSTIFGTFKQALPTSLAFISHVRLYSPSKRPLSRVSIQLVVYYFTVRVQYV